MPYADLGGDPFERRGAGGGDPFKRQLVARLQKPGCRVTITAVPAAA